jgi:hypothetical protein
MTAHMKHKHLLTFGSAMLVAWALGTLLFVYFWPHLVYNHFESAIIKKGFGGGPIPVNTLYIEPQTLFAEPLAAQSATSSNMMTTGANHDTLYTVGWLDLGKGPQVLHVPDMAERYYSVQFTDPMDGTDFAYVGTRTTGTQAGDYLITGPGWKGQVPIGMTQISSPNNSVLFLGRILVYSDSDLATAYGLAKQIQLRPLNQK